MLTTEAVKAIIETVEDNAPRVVVRFSKVSGEERRMECEIRRDGKDFTGVVWDIEKQAVRAFRLDLVHSISVCHICPRCSKRPAEGALCLGCS
jgi:hypothetical protein